MSELKQYPHKIRRENFLLTSGDNDPRGVGRAWRTTLSTSEHKTTPKHTTTTFNNIIEDVQKTSNHLFNNIIHMLTKYLLLIVETP